LTGGGVAQVGGDATILGLELFNRVERRVAREERDGRVQSPAGKQHQRKTGPGLLVADANGASFVEPAGPAASRLLSKCAWHRGHRRRRGLQYVAPCRIIHVGVLRKMTVSPRRRLQRAQKIAIGLSGDPVPPSTGMGPAVSMNSHRCSVAAASANASRSMLSKMFVPNPASSMVWTGCTTPSTRDGITSVAASLPTIATPRVLIHGSTLAWNPALLVATCHGPSALRRAHRPVRTKIASPGETFTFARRSHASMSST